MSVIKESLLADQGSSQYKNWLTRWEEREG
jgi:hypothetical protein